MEEVKQGLRIGKITINSYLLNMFSMCTVNFGSLFCYSFLLGSNKYSLYSFIIDKNTLEVSISFIHPSFSCYLLFILFHIKSLVMELTKAKKLPDYPW